MSKVRILSAAVVEDLLDATELRRSLESALVALADGHADVPPRIAAATPTGLLAAMPGYLANHAITGHTIAGHTIGGQDASSGRGLLATKLVSIYPDNIDTPSHQGLIAYFDAATGTLLAIMDAELITEDRTAGTAAIATDLLARVDADVLTIIGAGAQGRAHVRAFAHVRPWRTIRMSSRTRANADAIAGYATSLGLSADIDVVDMEDLDDTIPHAAVVALCTHADTAVFDPALIRPGTHVSSVGSRAELPAALVSENNVIVVDHAGAATTAPPAGAAELQDMLPGAAIELGALISGRAAGRTNDEQITIYKSTGHAVQDIAAARLVYEKAVAAEVGVIVDL